MLSELKEKPEPEWVAGVEEIDTEPDPDDPKQIQFIGLCESEVRGYGQEVIYRGELYWAKWANSRKNEKRFYIPQAQILHHLRSQSFRGICNARHFLELADGRKIILSKKLPQNGMTLQKKIIKHRSQRGTISEETAVEIILRVSDIIRRLHRVGVYHWDITPSNIWIMPDNKIILFDFDFAFRTKEEFMRRKLYDCVTPAYVSPMRLQWWAESNIASWDDLDNIIFEEVYSLSATLLAMLVGMGYTSSVVAFPRHKNSLPPKIKDILNKALRKDIGFKTVDEFIRAIEEVYPQLNTQPSPNASRADSEEERKADGLISQGTVALQRMDEAIARGEYEEVDLSDEIDGISSRVTKNASIEEETLRNAINRLSDPLDYLKGTPIAEKDREQVLDNLTERLCHNKLREALADLQRASTRTLAAQIEASNDFALGQNKLDDPTNPAIYYVEELLPNLNQSLKEEYIFHEALCRRKHFGHQEARVLQVILFRENYPKDNPEGELRDYLRGVVTTALVVQVEATRASRSDESNARRFLKLCKQLPNHEVLTEIIQMVLEGKGYMPDELQIRIQTRFEILRLWALEALGYDGIAEQLRKPPAVCKRLKSIAVKDIAEWLDEYGVTIQQVNEAIKEIRRKSQLRLFGGLKAWYGHYEKWINGEAEEPVPFGFNKGQPGKRAEVLALIEILDIPEPEIETGYLVPGKNEHGYLVGIIDMERKTQHAYLTCYLSGKKPKPVSSAPFNFKRHSREGELRLLVSGYGPVDLCWALKPIEVKQITRTAQYRANVLYIEKNNYIKVNIPKTCSSPYLIPEISGKDIADTSKTRIKLCESDGGVGVVEVIIWTDEEPYKWECNRLGEYIDPKEQSYRQWSNTEWPKYLGKERRTPIFPDTCRTRTLLARSVTEIGPYEEVQRCALKDPGSDERFIGLWAPGVDLTTTPPLAVIGSSLDEVPIPDNYEIIIPETAVGVSRAETTQTTSSAGVRSGTQEEPGDSLKMLAKQPWTPQAAEGFLPRNPIYERLARGALQGALGRSLAGMMERGGKPEGEPTEPEPAEAHGKRAIPTDKFKVIEMRKIIPFEEAKAISAKYQDPAPASPKIGLTIDTGDSDYSKEYQDLKGALRASIFSVGKSADVCFGEDLAGASVLLIGNSPIDLIREYPDVGSICLVDVKLNVLQRWDKELAEMQDKGAKLPKVSGFCINALDMPDELTETVDVIVEMDVLDKNLFSQAQSRQAATQAEGTLKRGGIYCRMALSNLAIGHFSPQMEKLTNPYAVSLAVSLFLKRKLDWEKPPNRPTMDMDPVVDMIPQVRDSNHVAERQKRKLSRTARGL
jgi:serine/threonine protein kinase